MEDATTNRGVSLVQLKVANVAAFTLNMFITILSVATDVISDKEVGETGNDDVLITPAGGAFSIWPVIYTLNALFLVYQFWWPKGDEHTLLHGVGFWFVAVNLFSLTWTCITVQNTDAGRWFAPVFILAMVGCLCKIYLNTGCWQTARPGGILQATLLDVQISMYVGWVTVASIVDVSITLSTIGTAGNVGWSVVMLLVALVLYMYIVFKFRDAVWGFVFAWATLFINVANISDDPEDTTSQVVADAAAVVCAIIFTFSAAVGAHTWYVWYKSKGDQAPPPENKLTEDLSMHEI